MKLRAGDVVEIRSKEEILATLDSAGRLDGLPFMPEMFQFCGRRVKVASRADKTCDTIESSGLRRMNNAVHLEGLRCGGEAHGGCDAACLIFWKEAWLTSPSPAGNSVPSASYQGTASAVPPGSAKTRALAPANGNTHICSEAAVNAAAHPAEDTYCCQTTELLRATTPLPWWDMRQYVRDVCSHNVTFIDVLRGWFYFIFRKTIRIKGYRAQIAVFNAIQKWRGHPPFPEFGGELTKTPKELLDLQPGELVRVKPLEEISRTLDRECHNRGLNFDIEMALHCGETFPVKKRVRRIVNERTGKMMELPGDCIVLEGVTCRAHYHQNCPRAIYPYWREIWLKRVSC